MQNPSSKNVYMIGIGGIAMGTLAGMLAEKGHHVTGSDQGLYPPMSTHLEALHIPVIQGYHADNPARVSPDIFIIGNVIRRENPEAQYVLSRNLPYLSMPQAIDSFFLSRHQSIVVAGTHGKSTTSSLLSWVLTAGGLDPSAFIGAILKNWQKSYRLGNGRYMVIEGDEYDTAFFDKGPKFLHYRPQTAVLTGIEYDHADIFPDFDSVYEAFRRFILLIPSDGTLIVNADDAVASKAAQECKGKVISYGWSEKADLRVLSVDYLPGQVRFTCKEPLSGKEQSVVSLLAGRHNLSNTLAVLAVSSVVGLPFQSFQDGLLTFQGVRRRQDIIGECDGIAVMDDFAHHPTAVKETLSAMRSFYPDRRIIAVFEPRTNSSRRRVFQAAYSKAFDDADLTCIKNPPGLDTIPQQERLDARALAHDIHLRGRESHYFENTPDLLHFLLSCCRKGDLVICMSNGSFDGLPLELHGNLVIRSRSRSIDKQG